MSEEFTFKAEVNDYFYFVFALIVVFLLWGFHKIGLW